jgi:hypothetical protein
MLLLNVERNEAGLPEPVRMRNSLMEYCHFDDYDMLFVAECIAIIVLVSLTTVVCFLTKEIYMIQRQHLPR